MRLNSSTVELTTAFEEHYPALYRFALSLSKSPSDASDLAQQAFYTAQVKGHQLRDHAKLKTWLATTLRRLFLQRRRHETRFPKREVGEVAHELPPLEVEPGAGHDASVARAALAQLAAPFRQPLEMFYLEDLSYRQIATALHIPLGTVMSRLSRGKRLLRERLDPAINVARN